MPGHLLDQVDTWIGIVSFGVSVLTYLRVRSVRRAQEYERMLVRRLYGTDSLSVQLRAAANFLRRGNDLQATDLAEELVRICGQIEGITRALDTSTRRSGQLNSPEITIWIYGFEILIP